MAAIKLDINKCYVCEFFINFEKVKDKVMDKAHETLGPSATDLLEE